MGELELRFWRGALRWLFLLAALVCLFPSVDLFRLFLASVAVSIVVESVVHELWLDE